MKKFGTPSGAAPGSANEKVGLAAVGTPGPVIVDAGVDPGLGVAVLLVVVVLVFVVPLTSLPEVVPELEKPPEPLACFLPEPDEPPGCELVVVVVLVVGVVLVEVGPAVTVGVVLVVVGAQLAVTLWTGGVPGGNIEAGDVPGAALTLKVSVCPLTVVAVTVH
jgi:hypothetical protein